MNFNERLVSWNGGVKRGAPRKIAAALGVSETYVSAWRKGRGVPGEELLRKIATLFKISDAEAARMFATKIKSHDSEIEKLRGEMDLIREQVEHLRTFVEDTHRLKRGTLLRR